MNDYFWGLAQRSADIAGNPIKPEWIYSQFAHETGDFTSDMCVQYHNLGGVTQSQPNDTPQPDGDYFYMQFPTFEDYAEYFGSYLIKYRGDGIFDSQNLEDYITALHNGGYFGDSLENYLSDCQRIMAENFPGVE